MFAKFAPFFLLACGILRSTDLFFRTPIIKKIPILTLISWEHFVNFLLVLPLIFIFRKEYKKLNLKDFGLFCLIGFGASALGILCFTEAFAFMNPALAVLLQKLQPIFSIALGVIVLKEKPKKGFFLWAAVAILASYLVSFGTTNPFSGEGYKIAIGSFFALAAAFFWGGGTIWGKILLKKYNQGFLVANRFLFGFAFCLVLSFATGKGTGIELVMANGSDNLWSIFYMATISGLIATSFFYSGLRWVDATLASILELVFPFSSVAIMWMFFNRPISTVQIFASAVLFFSMYKIAKGGQKKLEEEKEVA